MNLKSKLLFKKLLLKWANKKQIILIFTMLHFFKKITKNTCRYHYEKLDDIIYSTWDTEQNKLKLIILGHFLSFIPLKTPKIKILKNKNLLEIPSFYTCVPKIWDTVKTFLSFWAIFWPFTSAPHPNDPEYQNFQKKEKNGSRYYPFIHTCVPLIKILWYMVPEI